MFTATRYCSAFLVLTLLTATAIADPIDPYLATPASGAIYEIPFVVIRYIPTVNGGADVDPDTGYTGTVASLIAKIDRMNKQTKFSLEEGSKFRGYANGSAAPSLGYKCVGVHTVYEKAPPGISAPGGGGHFPDMHEILGDVDAEDYVENQGVKEFWLWVYHADGIIPVESNMASPTTGDISNSYRHPNDMPIFDTTYIAYSYNYTRSSNEAVHNHGHQQEAQLSHVNNLRDGNTTLWWGQFATYQRCGNTHKPPNTQQDYNYTSSTSVQSDIKAWVPSGGSTQSTNANTWGSINYAWPDNVPPTLQTEGHWYIFWYQAYPGYNNNISYGGGETLTNWWRFTADWDNSILNNWGLHGTGTPSNTYQFSASSYTVAENVTPITITVTRTGNTGTAGTVQYATSNGSATAGSDYTSASGTLNFAVGQTSRTFDVTILDDSNFEGNETINLALSNPTGGSTLGTPSSATITIDEDELSYGSFQFSTENYQVSEGSSSVTITVKRVNGSDGTVTVDYATSDGTATSSSDYTSTSGTFTYTQGQTSKTFTVPITHDTDVEDDEIFNVTLSNPTGGADLGTPTTGVVTILNNDPTIADLTWNDFETSITSAGKLQVKSWVKNEGFAATSGTIYLHHYRSADAVYDGSDVLVSTDTRGSSLPVGNIWSPTKNNTITGTDPGDYYIIGVVDPNNTMSEVVETNNVSTPILTSLKPNLFFSGDTWTPTTTTLKSVLTIKNDGPARVTTDIKVNVYLSTDTEITTSDYLIGTYTITGITLDSLNTRKDTYTWTIPGSVPAGTYYAGCIVDPDNTIDEWDEDDNDQRKQQSNYYDP